MEQPPTLDYIDTLEREAQRKANLAANQPANVSGVDVRVPNAAGSHRKATLKQQTKQEVVLEARSIIIKELREAFKTDLRRRLAANFVRDAWVKHDANPSSLTKDVRSSPTKSEQAASNAHRASASQSSQASTQNVQEAHKLPSFGRQDHRDGLRGEESSFTDVRARSTTPAFIAKRPDDDSAEDVKAAVIESNQSKPVDDNDAMDVRTVDVSKFTGQKKHTSDRKVRKKGKLAKKVEVLHFTSSEEDDEDGDDDVPLAQRNVKPGIIGAEARQITPESLKDDMVMESADPKPEEDPVLVIVPEPHEDQTPSEAVINLPTPAPSDSTTPSTKRELSDSVEEPAKRQRLLSPEVAEPDTVAVTDVSERVEAVRPAARKAAPKGKGKGKRAAKPKKKASATPTPEVDPYSMIVDRLKEEDQEDLFYAKIAVKLRKARHPLPPLEPPEEGEDDDLQVIDPRHETGCARTEGYYKIPQPEKLRYLLARNQGKTESAKEASSSLSVSRLARANARHLASGLDKHKKATATDTDLLQLNQLRTRKKQLRFARSPIHDWGLYALEYIPAGEMVIEYVGEQIRQQVADKREKAYERQGIGSSYLLWVRMIFS